MGKCRISIIIPVYNLEDYIKDCIQSLIPSNDSGLYYEIICIDDGSTDDSGKILDKYAELYSCLKVYHQSNQGVSSARNLGLEKAVGEYIWFVDGDDLVAKDSIPEIIDGIEQNECPDILYIGIKSFDDNDLSDVHFETLPIEEESGQYAGWIVTEIIKAKYIHEHNLRFDVDISYGEDDIFCVFLHQYITTTKKLNKVLYYYRQREGSALHSGINENSIERTMKTYSAELKYADTYDFFWYKRDGVYNRMPNLMAYIAQLPNKIANKHIKKLKEYHLFPLPPYRATTENQNNKQIISGAKRIRMHSYESHFGYLVLRLYMKYQKVINLFKHKQQK